MQTVFQQIASHSVAEAVKEVGADTYQRQDNPGLILKQITKLLKLKFLGTYRLQALLGQESASQGTSSSYHTKKSTQHRILVLLGSTHQSLQVRERQQGHKTHRIGTYHTETRELVLLVVVIRHHTQQRAIRHVHRGVQGHHQQIQTISPDTLTCQPEVRRVQQQGKHQSEGDGAEYQPGTIRTPFALCTVSERSHQRVGHHVKHTCNQHQRGCISECQSKHICKKQREGNRHNFPGDTTSRRIA